MPLPLPLMKAIDKGKAVCLVLLDLSATFNTVDYKILLHRLEDEYNITDKAIKWIHFYLSGRKQRVAVGDIGVDGVTSDCITLTYGYLKG